MPIDFFHVIDIFGTFSFAVSGTSSAMRKQLDIFGVLIIAFVTSIGGGTLRDILIGNTPVAWLTNSTTINVILVASIGTIFFGTFIRKFNHTLFLFDSLGLGLFTIIGIQKGIELHFSPGICVALGTVTGCFGGVARDILLNEIPLIFRKEIYASACIVGGSVFYLLHALTIDDRFAQVVCISVIVVIRIIVVRYKLSLPSFYKKKGDRY
ncbi:MAG: trimeric intracellular cation channel family protein [Chitinophagaceae bacterium]